MDDLSRSVLTAGLPAVGLRDAPRSEEKQEPTSVPVRPPRCPSGVWLSTLVTSETHPHQGLYAGRSWTRSKVRVETQQQLFSGKQQRTESVQENQDFIYE